MSTALIRQSMVPRDVILSTKNIAWLNQLFSGRGDRVFANYNVYKRFISRGPGAGPNDKISKPAQSAKSTGTVQARIASRSHSMGMFQSFFTRLSDKHPSRHLLLKRHTLRWDWHLRLFIYSLMPACAIGLIGSWIQWYYADQMEELRMFVDDPQVLKQEIDNERVSRHESAEQADKKIESLFAELRALRKDMENLKASPLKSSSQNQTQQVKAEPNVPPAKSNESRPPPAS